MNTKNAASAATAKPCLDEFIDDADKASAAVHSVLQQFLESTTNGCVINGEFGGDDDDREIITDIVAAMAGLSDLTGDLDSANAAIDRLKDENADLKKQIDDVRVMIYRSAEMSNADRVAHFKAVQAGLAAESVIIPFGTAATIGGQDYVLQEPATGTNPEATAHAKFTQTSSPVKPVSISESVIKNDFRNIQMSHGDVNISGNAEDLDMLLTAVRNGWRLAV